MIPSDTLQALVADGAAKSLSLSELEGLAQRITRWRTIPYEVFPLSFVEFLRFRGLQHEPYSTLSESRVSAALNDYLAIGGLPEVVLAEPELRPRILQEYVDLVFYKDWVERYKVANPALLRQLPSRIDVGHQLGSAVYLRARSAATNGNANRALASAVTAQPSTYVLREQPHTGADAGERASRHGT